MHSTTLNLKELNDIVHAMWGVRIGTAKLMVEDTFTRTTHITCPLKGNSRTLKTQAKTATPPTGSLGRARCLVIFVKCVGRHGEAQTRAVPVVRRVILALEHVTQNKERATRRRYVQAHEAEHAHAAIVVALNVETGLDIKLVIAEIEGDNGKLVSIRAVAVQLGHAFDDLGHSRGGARVKRGTRVQDSAARGRFRAQAHGDAIDTDGRHGHLPVHGAADRNPKDGAREELLVGLTKRHGRLQLGCVRIEKRKLVGCQYLLLDHSVHEQGVLGRGQLWWKRRTRKRTRT
jgi:hypothetical protein